MTDTDTPDELDELQRLAEGNCRAEFVGRAVAAGLSEAEASYYFDHPSALESVDLDKPRSYQTDDGELVIAVPMSQQFISTDDPVEVRP